MDFPVDKNAAFLWSIIIMGIALPFLLGLYSIIRVRLAKSRLDRMREEKS